MPTDGSLDVTHFQKFMKRLRKKIRPKKVRYYHCGEYGDQTYRPHYHAILFGYDFKDKKLLKIRNENRIYISEELDELWKKGFCTVGDATFESAGYVARYIMKKVTGGDQEAHYERIDPITGEVINLKPEYTTMSRKPGIGSGWLEKFKSDVYPSDQVVINGKVTRPPKFYDRKLLESEKPEDKKLLHVVKNKRVERNKERKEDQTQERLEVREKVQEARFNQLKRGF